jgi:hypothetical protein
MTAFKFDEAKATQAACRLIHRRGGEIDYGSLVKLLYLVDREAIKRWGRPITGDQIVSMPRGPVLSTILDWVRNRFEVGEGTYWLAHIERCSSPRLRERKSPGLDDLSDAEVELIDGIAERFQDMSWPDLRDFCHDPENCPEWQDPGGSSAPIPFERVMESTGRSEEQIAISKSLARSSLRFDHVMKAALDV